MMSGCHDGRNDFQLFVDDDGTICSGFGFPSLGLANCEINCNGQCLLC